MVARFLDTEEVTGSNPVPPIEKHSTDDVECFFTFLRALDWLLQSQPAKMLVDDLCSVSDTVLKQLRQ